MAASHPAVYVASFAKRGEFDTIVDVRSPAEFALDHIPGAINCPVLNDSERILVGTTYAKVSPFEARKLGAALVARNIAHHLEASFATQPRNWRPLIYCWRGGQRSAAMATVLGQVGWSARQLEGGYKAFRRHVIGELALCGAALQLVVLCGPTGSGKTALLEALAAIGEQVLDLEGLACHKGSVLGADPGSAQPSQKAFETALWTAIGRFDAERIVWVEAESRRIGTVSLPDPLFTNLVNARCVALEAPLTARIAHLRERYASLMLDAAQFKTNLSRLSELHGRKTVALWVAQVDAGAWDELALDLVVRHYDPAYRRHGHALYRRLALAPKLDIETLDAGTLAGAARQLAAHPPAL
jgi:tRNA 2-selenouridine synthase